jgi:DNA-binding transcriptional ArsR family regulator
MADPRSWQLQRSISITRSIEDLAALDSANSENVRLILEDLAGHLMNTEGELSEKAVDEIACAFLAGVDCAAAEYVGLADAKAAKLAVVPLLTAINRVR